MVYSRLVKQIKESACDDCEGKTSCPYVEALEANGSQCKYGL